MKDSIESEQLIIGNRIRDARVAKGMSQTDLAEKANLSLPVLQMNTSYKVVCRITKD